MTVHKGVGHYGAPITLDQAKKVMAAAEAKATQNNWNVVISIVDSGGHAVMLQRLDGSHLAAIGIAEGKARTAVEFRRPTKALEDAMAGGGVGLGAAVGWAITYWYTTYEKRAILRVRHEIDHLGSYHKLSKPEYRKTLFPAKNLVSDEEVLEMYNWAMDVCRDIKKKHKRKWSADKLAAEAIICEKLFNLRRGHAARTFFQWPLHHPYRW